MMSLEDFNTLSQERDMETVVTDAYQAQQQEEGRRRSRRGRRERGGRRQRVDYTTPEYAGEPHRGRITDAEKEYIRNNLDAVNKRLARDGHQIIDPNDSELAERYGLT